MEKRVLPVLVFLSVLAGVAFAQITTLGTRPRVCLNGGLCTSYNATGFCENCNCTQGYGGPYCQLIGTLVSGHALYSRPANASNLPINRTAIQEIIAETLAPSVSNPTVIALSGGTTNVGIKLSIRFQRPATWSNCTSWAPLEQQLAAVLKQESSIEWIFGAIENAQFQRLSLAVEECRSMWHNCAINATCYDIAAGFRCVCDGGYAGDGTTCTAIMCSLSKSPPTPAMGTRKVIDPNGKVLNNPHDVLPYGTLVEFSCPKHYVLADATTSSTDPVVVECGSSPKYLNSNWSGSNVSCNIDFSLKIAIILSVASILIIMLVTGCFLVNCCVQRERRAKQRRLDDDNSAFDNHSFDQA